MGTNRTPLLADIVLYSYAAEFIQSLLSTDRKQLASPFNFTHRTINDVLSINSPEFANYLDQMYPVEIEIKDTIGSTTSASYLDILLSIGRGGGQLHTSIYDKCDDFNFYITNFPFLSFTPMVSLSQSLYYMPGLATRMNVLLWGRHDFKISFSNRDTSKNTWNRHWRRFLEDTGILSNNKKFLSTSA